MAHYTRTTLLTHLEAEKFLYNQTKQSVDKDSPEKSTRKRIRANLRYAIDKKKNLACLPDGRIAFGYLIAWARGRKQWTRIFDDFPQTVGVRCAHEAEYDPLLELEPLYPATIGECGSELCRLLDLLGVKRATVVRLLEFAQDYPGYRKKCGAGLYLLRRLADEPPEDFPNDIQTFHHQISRMAELLEFRETHLPHFLSLAERHHAFIESSRDNGKSGGRGNEK